MDVPDFSVRPYREGDSEAVARLDTSDPPYRPEDQAAVAAMFARARLAERRGDPLWIPPVPPGDVGTDELAVWVAESRPDCLVIGMLGLYQFGMNALLPQAMQQAHVWRTRADVAELRRLRVAPAWRRQGVATALNRAAFAWARASGLREIVLNTTAAQAPALNLYRNLGFREEFRSYVGRFELVWMALRL